MKFRYILILAWLALGLGACSLAEDITPPPGYQSPTPPPTMGPLFPANPPDLASGAAIFVEKCAPCHGVQGLGDGPQAANLPKQPAALGKPEIAGTAIPADWYTIVTRGKIESLMPPFNSLSDQERWDVVFYALSLSSTSEQLAQGKAVYEANCANCHGADGKKSAKSDFSDQALMAKLAQTDLVNYITKGMNGMPGFSGKLSETDGDAVAAYLRTFTFASAQAAAALPSTTTTVAPAGSDQGTPATDTSSVTATVTSIASVSATGTPGEIIGTISGKVSKGPNGSLPSDLKAVLHIYTHDPTNSQFSEVASQETALNADDTYSFINVSMPANQAFYVSVDYADTTYQSDPLIPKEGQSVYDLPITIYDTTTDMSALTADQVHILLDYSKPDIIQVVEFYVISNPGEKTVIAGQKGEPIVTLSLPKGYTNLQFQDGQLGDRFLQTADGFGDTAPVIPGNQQYQLVFAFDLPYSNNFEFAQPFSLNVSAVTFLVSEGVRAEGQNLMDGGVQEMADGGGKFQLYNAGSFKSGESLTLTISGKAQQGAAATIPAGGSTRSLAIGLSTLGLAVLLSGFWLYMRRQNRIPEDESLKQGDIETGSRDEILDAILAVDDQYNAGNISEEAYKQRRSELKEKIRRIESKE